MKAGLMTMGYVGHLWVVFATSSRSSTERHGDFSESVVFHFRPRCPFWLCVLGCLCGGFLSCFLCLLVTPWSLSHLFSLTGESPIKTRCIDDRLSFKRARHRQKKIYSPPPPPRWAVHLGSSGVPLSPSRIPHTILTTIPPALGRPFRAVWSGTTFYPLLPSPPRSPHFHNFAPWISAPGGDPRTSFYLPLPCES